MCYEEGAVLGWLLSYVLYYPWVVWAGFMIAGVLFRSPLLLYKSYVSGVGTWLIAWGLGTLLKWPRPPGQECDTSYAFPDVGLHVATVNTLVLLVLIVVTRSGVHYLAIVWFFGWTVLYFVAIFVNHYLTAMQLGFNIASVLMMTSFWSATYLTLVRPIIVSLGYAELSNIGLPVAPAKSARRVVSAGDSPS